MPLTKFFALALSVLLFSPLAYSQTATITQIEDPKNLLPQIDEFVSPALPFSQEFVCGQVGTFDHTVDSCTFSCVTKDDSDECNSNCTGVSRVATHTVSQCSSSQISIFSDDAENVDYSNLEYANLNNDLVRKFMANLSTYISASGKIVLTSVAQTNFVLVPGQTSSPSFPALNITGTFVLDGYNSGPIVLFTVLKGAPGVAQIARFRIDDWTWFRLKTIGTGN